MADDGKAAERVVGGPAGKANSESSIEVAFVILYVLVEAVSLVLAQSFPLNCGGTRPFAIFVCDVPITR